MPILPPRNLPLSPTSSSGKGSSSSSSKNTSINNSNQNDKGNSNKRIVSTPLRKVAGSAIPSTPSPSKSGRGVVDGGFESQSGTSSPFVHSNAAATATGDTSISSINSTTTESGGQLSRQNETTFHRKLRILLWDHRLAREQWEDIVSIEGAKTISSITRYAQRLDELIKIDLQKGGEAGDSEKNEDLPELLKISKDEIKVRNLDEMKKVLKNLENDQLSLEIILQKIEKHIKKLQTLSEAGENLLIEAIKSKGDVFVFDQEAWLTWPMAKFVDVIQSLTSRFTLQTDHLRSIVRVLNDQGCATGKNANNQEEDSKLRDRKERDEDEDDEVSEEENEEKEKNQESNASKQARKLRALIRQRVLEEWQTLKFLRDDHNLDPMWFEDICEAEVGRWDER